MLYSIIDSPVGPLLLRGDGETLSGLSFLGGSRQPHLDPGRRRDDSAFAPVTEQLREYFAGERRHFDVPLALAGNPFELRVWDALQQIPYGETMSYGEIAGSVCTRGAARAVGAANGRNPVAVIVPCHRVIGVDGSLTGFGGGLDRKRYLLDLEAGVQPLLATAG